jgi:hypothetical protein
MTSEGGAFYGGMAAGAETLAGKTSTLKDTWKEFKATFAETSGLGAWWKEQMESWTLVVRSYIDAMNERKALEEAARADKTGDATAEQKIVLLDDQIKRLKEALALSRQFPGIGEAELKNQLKTYENAGMQNDMAAANLKIELNTIAAYNEQIRSLEKMKQPYQAALDLAAERRAEEERLKAIVADTGREYEGALAEINAKYAETSAGKIKAIEAEIQKYKEYLTVRKQEIYTTPIGDRLVSTGLGDGEKEKIAGIIAMLEESLSRALGKSKADLTEWRKVLKEAMGFSDEDIKKGVLATGPKAVEEYARRVEEAGSRVTSLNGLLGDESGLLKDTADKWEKLLRAMVESGQWKETEASFRMVVENLREAKQALADDGYAQKIGELRKKIDDLGKSESELAREAMKAGGYTGEQADAVKALMDQYGREEILSSFREEVSRLGKDQYELALETLRAKGATSEEIDELERYITVLREAAAKAGKSWEEVFAARVSSDVRGIFPSLSREAADAAGNISASIASISFDSVLQGLSDAGKAFALGDDAAQSFADAMGQMVLQILENLPSLFLQAGLQLIAQGQWPLGLGFVAAAGSTAIIGGYVKGKIEEESGAKRNARGNIFDEALARAYAKGGSFTNQIVSGPTYFRHGGGLGLMGEAGPEAVIPLKRMSNGDLGVSANSGGGSSVTVNIINNSGAEVSREEREDGYGNKEIDVIIGKMIDNHLASGRADRALASRYDVKVKGV